MYESSRTPRERSPVTPSCAKLLRAPVSRTASGRSLRRGSTCEGEEEKKDEDEKEKIEEKREQKEEEEKQAKTRT